MDLLRRKDGEYVKFIKVQANAMSATGPTVEFAADDLDGAYAKAREWADVYPAVTVSNEWRPVRDEDSEEVFGVPVVSWFA